jgi:hypothetical protein
MAAVVMAETHLHSALLVRILLMSGLALMVHLSIAKLEEDQEEARRQ